MYYVLDQGEVGISQEKGDKNHTEFEKGVTSAKYNERKQRAELKPSVSYV